MSKKQPKAKLGDLQKVCSHYTYEGNVHLNKALNEIWSSTDAKPCQVCPKDTGIPENSEKKKKKKKARAATKVVTEMWVCLTCQGYFCGSDNHIRTHTQETEHWWAVKNNDPSNIYCFKCRREVLVWSPEGHKEEVARIELRFVIAGLRTLGKESCFNAVLQNLLSLHLLREEILGTEFPKTACIAIALRELFVRTNTFGISVSLKLDEDINPSTLLSHMVQIDPDFRSRDSEQTFSNFLSALNEDEKKAWAAAHVIVDSTLVDSIFGGECSITASCSECSERLSEKQIFFHLSLPFVQSTDNEFNVSIEECLKAYTDPQAWTCNKCTEAGFNKDTIRKGRHGDDKMKGSGAGTRRIWISRPPQVLTLHLKRKESDEQSKKLKIRVNPQDKLHIRPFMDPSCGVYGNIAYRLAGVVQLNQTSGHYVANVKAISYQNPFSHWFEAIDLQLKKISLKSVEGEPHLLFYRKVPDQDNPLQVPDQDNPLQPEKSEKVIMEGGVVKKGKEPPLEQIGDKIPPSGSHPMEPHEGLANLLGMVECAADLTREGSQLVNTLPQFSANPMGEESHADSNMQPPTSASVSGSSLAPQDGVNIWEYQRTRNLDRQARNRLDQVNDTLGQRVGVFLDWYTLDGDTKPFYLCEVVTMCERGSGSRELNIRYSHLESYSKDLAMDVCNGYEGLSLNLKEAAVNFAKKLAADEKLILTDTARKRLEKIASQMDLDSCLEIKFLEMPKVHRLLKHYLVPPLTEEMHVFGHGRPVRMPVPHKCSLVQRLLTDVINDHRVGLSWDGDFTLDDMVLKDDRVFIAKKPKRFSIHPAISPEMISAMGNDFSRIAVLVIVKFRYWEADCMQAKIPHLETFYRMLTNMHRYDEWWPNNEKAEGVRDLIEHQPFLKPGMARSNLWIGMFTANRSHDAGDWSVPFKKILENHSSESTSGPWYHKTYFGSKGNQMAKGVFKYKDKKIVATDPVTTDQAAAAATDQAAAATTQPYYVHGTIDYLIEYVRHLAIHGSAYSFLYRPRGTGPRTQLMQSLEEPEAAAAYALDEEMVEVLEVLLKNSAMTGLLKSVWECYKSSNHPYRPE